jgi:prephenate dehydrogenase
MRRAGACRRIAGWDTSPTALDDALRLRVIDEVDAAFACASSPDGVSSSDLVYLSMPVGEIIRFLRESGWRMKPGVVLTDAGSTKEEVCRAAREGLLADRRFVGGHPVAGSHLRGLAHARADMFENAPYVLTNVEHETSRTALAALEATFGLFGARVHVLSAGEHDRAMALMSHLPQLVSSLLAAVVREQPDADALNALSGSGYRDMTRLAGSSWAVWRDILATNPAKVAAALDAFAEKLDAVRQELRNYPAHDAPHTLDVTSSLFENPQQT